MVYYKESSLLRTTERD